jgi:hypothetical protein
MAYGHYEGKDISHPELRKYFDREFVLKSEWYHARLKLKQQKDTDFLKNQIEYLIDFIAQPNNNELVKDMQILNRLENAKNQLKHVESEKYLEELIGTIGADFLFQKK